MPLSLSNLNKSILIALLLSLFFIMELKAQQSEGCVFLQGDYIEIGIAPNGAFGTPANAPAGYHPRPTPLLNSLYNPVTNTFQLRAGAVGFVADYGKDGWTVGSPPFFGDYFMPGNIQEGFSLQINGVRSNAWSNNYQTNGSTGFTGPLTGSNTSLTATATEKKAVWQGTMTDLLVRQTIVIKNAKSYFTANIFLKNTGIDTLKQIYYMRTVDPDNEVSYTNSFITKNKIAYQLPNVSNKTLVTATGLLYQAYLGLGTKDCQARSFILQSGLFPTADLLSIYNGASGYIYTDSLTGDVGIGVIFKIGNLAPGDSTTFSYAYILNENDLDEAFTQTEPGFFYNGNYYSSGSVIIQPIATVLPIDIVNGDYYNWTWAPPTFLDVSTGTHVNATVSPAPVTYTVTGVSTGSISTLCSNRTINITISPFAVSPPPTVVSPVNYCLNQVASALSATGLGIIRWYTAPTGGVGSLIAPIPSTSSPGTTTWYVTQELSGTESVRIPVVVNVIPPPTVIITPVAPVICFGDSTMLAASGTPSLYAWAPAATLSAATGNSVIAFPNSTTVYTITATDSNSCKNTKTVTLQVNPLPPVTVTPASGSVCAGDILQLTANGSVSYTWNASGTLNTTTGPVVIATPLTTTTYYVTGTDANSCKKQVSVMVVVNPLPRPNLGVDKSICKESATVLSPGNFKNYVWYDNSTAPTHAINNLGLYWVKVENNFGCIASDTIRIISFFTNPANFLPGDTSFCRGNQHVIHVPGYTQYLWDDGSIFPSITIKRFGQITLTVKDNNGCYGTDSMRLFDAKCIRYALPNAFTPNKDGKNDVFRPFLTQIVTDYNMTIWNRWGEIMYTSSEPQKGWNGYYKAQQQSPGTYIYSIRFTDSDGLPVSLKGTVNIIR
jgi:gliding motility-associated-like protein